ncbi:hypothetical protein BSL78_17579 [Apostichopus japonicus]|uniref:Reverse transcriptase domain-containing protein n=1 Tax=Stichopus japonicus TaxID=307972 RepID=A0A2G8KC31_STIJA|nr:hypothetical protein BSL78_17579 [Apostichopus japonicus]
MAPEISGPLAILFNKSLDEGIVPDDWRAANVIPIFKKGSKHDPCNYRPVSLTSTACKILEMLIKDAIIKHLDDHQLLKDTQHGFTKGRSTLSNLLTFLEYVTNEVDKGYPVDVVYLDFAKAFDKVAHKRLVSKIESHGISGSVSAWISAWLNGRRQRVALNGTFSSWLPVKVEFHRVQSLDHLILDFHQ